MIARRRDFLGSLCPYDRGVGPNVKIVSSDNVSVLDVVAHDYLLITQTALEELEGALQ